ncbi:MAG: PIN domain-containing protein [Candidatus Micrarchaeota archaeon]
MKLVVDANIIYAGIVARGFTLKLLLDPKLELFAPEYLFSELYGETREICRKTRLSEDEIGEVIEIM